MTDQTTKSTAEKIETAPLTQNAQESSERQDFSEIKETKDRFASSVDANLEGSESIENVDGNIVETSGDGKDLKGDAAGTTAATYDPATIKANLLKNIPVPEVMRAQIKKEIEEEIKYLHNKAMKMMKSPNVNYFEMSNVMKKIRELKTILLNLAKASMENLKNLWLKFVHGIM
jgi:hypothetical protein